MVNIVISGPSGAGKSSLVNLCRNDKEINRIIHIMISTTSRKKRELEKNNISYHFVTKEKFEKMISMNKFLEYEKYIDNYYGLSKDEILKDKINIAEIDVRGALSIKKLYKHALLIFIKPVDISVLKKRLIRRDKDIKNIKNRLQRAKVELDFESYFNISIINDNIDNAYEILKRYIIKTYGKR